MTDYWHQRQQMIDDDFEIKPSAQRVPLTPEMRRKIIERLLPDKIAPYLTVEERAQYAPR